MAPGALDAVVVFTGRGGSGTRLLSQLAAGAGIFIGNQVNKSGDSTEWVDLIYRMVVEAGGQRDLPSGSPYRREIRARAAEILGAAPQRKSELWGLKLPELMLILPLLIDAFPRAKVVHITRHPVSSSLRRTHMTSRLDNPVGIVALPAAYRYSNRDAEEIETDEPYLHNAYSWNFQVTRVLHYARDVLGEAQYLEIKYEDLCIQPDHVLALVRSYLGCADDRAGASIQADPARAGAWDSRDTRVQTIWQICGKTAGLLGYTRDPDESMPTRLSDRSPYGVKLGSIKSVGGRELELILSIPGSTDPEEVSLLYDLARQVTRGCIVEVGSAKGRSTVALALGAKSGGRAPVYAIEPHEHSQGVLGGVFTPRNRATFLDSLLRSDTVEIVRLVNLSSEVVAPGWQQEAGLVFIDGDHRFERVLCDFECWAKHLVEGGLMVLHDSTDPSLGPSKVIALALMSGEYEMIGVISRATILRKIRSAKSDSAKAR